MFRYIVAAVVVALLVFFTVFLLPYFRQVTCPGCGGKAIVRVGIVDVPCPYCKGRGKIADYYLDKVLKELEQVKKKKQEEDAKEAATATAVAVQYSNSAVEAPPPMESQPEPAQ